MNAHVSKADLRRHVVPLVKEFLKSSGKAEFFRERDQVGHKIHTHASNFKPPWNYPAEIIYETCSWVDEFLIWLERTQSDTDLSNYFEFEYCSSVILEVRRVGV